MLAAFDFFDEIEKRYGKLKNFENSFISKRISSLLCLFNIEIVSGEIQKASAPSNYSLMHRCLAPFDETLDKSELRKKLVASIQSLYNSHDEKEDKDQLQSLVLTDSASACKYYEDWKIQETYSVILDPTQPYKRKSN